MLEQSFLKSLQSDEMQRPLYVAELSGNHNKSIKNALLLIKSAADSGADAVKFQTYTADSITMNCDNAQFLISNPKSVWNGRKLYDLYSEASTPWDWFDELIECAVENHLTWFSSPFDATAVDFLEGHNAPLYKVASPEIVDLPLIKVIASTGKPIVMSCGMASIPEIYEAVAVARQNGCNDITLLKCTTSYPASAEEANIKAMNSLKNTFGCKVGLSDHSLTNTIPVLSVAFGAKIIEKHITLDRSEGGPDASFSLEPDEFLRFTNSCTEAYIALGSESISPTPSEIPYINGRRSLYVVATVKRGDIFNSNNIRSIRPGFGLKPRQYDKVLGRIAKYDIEAGTPLSWDLIE